MVDTSNKANKIRGRDIYYYRQRFKNRVASKLMSFYEEEAKRHGISQRAIAEKLGREPSQISRWLNHPSNLTLETISDLLLALDAEAEPPVIVRFEERPIKNYAHPVLARFLGKDDTKQLPRKVIEEKASPIKSQNDFNLKIVSA